MTGPGPRRPATISEFQAYLDQLRREDAAAMAAHRRRMREIAARGPRVIHGPAIPPGTTWPCTAGCGRPVTLSDWAVHDPGTGLAWHADCWHATEAPGQGDLLDVLQVMSR